VTLVLNRKIVLLGVLVMLFAVAVHREFLAVFGWGNGSYSTDPNNPNYGTHDWIAHHALDWLPQAEKQFILENLATYLYGTELPDNKNAPDGIGDTTKHHVYFFANGSLQDDIGAVRAQEEYNNALSLYKSGQTVDAVKRLGMMTHYIADLAVFGHVMGSGTDWGAETHHSDYEDYVERRTDNYDDDFNIFLQFDGSLDVITAYDAALNLAYDTTFDVDGNLTCVWMDQNYNWSDPTFRNRCGESLNLAVNLITDVLHTFAMETDSTPPQIGIPIREPQGDVQPFQEVKISVNVTDAESGVEIVILSFTTDGGATWENRTMDFNASTSLYEAFIPGQEAETTVRFKIIAYDVAGNVAVLDGEQSYCIYVVVPELRLIPALACLALASTFPCIFKARKLKSRK